MDIDQLCLEVIVAHSYYYLAVDVILLFMASYGFFLEERIKLVLYLGDLVLIRVVQIVVHGYVFLARKLLFQLGEINYLYDSVHCAYLSKGVLSNLIFYRWRYLLFRHTCL